MSCRLHYNCVILTSPLYSNGTSACEPTDLSIVLFFVFSFVCLFVFQVQFVEFQNRILLTFTTRYTNSNVHNVLATNIHCLGVGCIQPEEFCLQPSFFLLVLRLLTLCWIGWPLVLELSAMSFICKVQVVLG